MKGKLLILALLVLSFGLAAQTVLSCYDVQYTTAANGNSNYNGQNVTVQGIVTHVIPNSAFYISDETGGPWSGLYVYHRNTSNAVSLGDMVKLTGRITEYYSLTEMDNISAYEILSQGNTLPPAADLSTSEIAYGAASSEQWEGVLVRVTDVQIKSGVDNYGQFLIADSSNVQAMVDNGLYAIPSGSIITGEWWYIIQGIVDYHSSAGYKINPRAASDMVKQDSIENSIVKIIKTDPASNPVLNQTFKMSLVSTKVKYDWGVQRYEATLRIDPSKVLFEGLEIDSTATPEMPNYTISSAGDEISWVVDYPGGLYSDQEVLLIKMLFRPIVYGETQIDLYNFKYNTTSVNTLVDGNLLTKLTEKIAYLNIGKDGDKKNIFNPYLNEKITLTYGVKTGYLAKAVIRIYDAQGRLVFTPVHSNSFPATGFSSYEWNGRDANLKLLPPGLYHCHLEVTDRTNGDSDSTVQPLVIKSTLK